VTDRDREIAFPKLTSEQIAAVERVATPKTYRDGETIFAAGDRGFKFVVVLSGGVEIVEYSTGEMRRVVMHEPGHFTGDVDMLTGRPAVVTAIARGDCRVLEMGQGDLRRLIGDRPELGDLILQAFIARRHLLVASSFIGCRVIGSRFSRDTFRVRDFLSKNRVPFTWVDVEDDPVAAKLLEEFHVTDADTPVVACGNKLLLKRPSNRELADRLGILQRLDGDLFDLVVVGAGPAGLAAAVYGASEGLSTVVLDEMAPGGQAGSSMRIENYLGFPTGITGSELTARATLQAQKFGAKLTAPVQALGLDADGPFHCIRLDGGQCVTARCILIATGAEYHRLNVPDLDRYEGLGVYYAATPVEAPGCRGQTAVVVGGGNSAGQAVNFLAEHAARVLLVIRGADLSRSMSRYLIDRIAATSTIEVLSQSEVTRLVGDDCLHAVEVTNRATGQTRTIETPAVFSFIGAAPRTDWLPDAIAKDNKGFLLTGPDATATGKWTQRRPPFLLETTLPGVFAAGDVRRGSSKRVAAAVGEGSMAVQFVHEAMKGR
jgi:thioredoxin reductase (NADPH)